MKAIDLFCGAGGLTCGLRQAGWDVAAGIDVDTCVGETYRRNNLGSRFVPADIRSVRGQDILSLVGRTPPRELLLAGCAPCQPFSKQNRYRGAQKGGEATLLREFARLVREVKPGVVLMENVPGVAAVPGFSSFRRFLRTLRECGYEYSASVLNASDFGVPQHRKRLVVLALRHGDVELAAPTRLTDQATTVRRTIAQFPAIEAGESHPSLPNHEASPLSSKNLERIRATPPDGGARKTWPPHLNLDCHNRAGTGFNDVYGRMWWDRTAPTLTGKCNSLSNGRFGHPEQHRAISLREAAALQTFADDYDFDGFRSHIAKWIGNAVPVSFAKELGTAAFKCIP
ncbi:MAG: DNA cytosine methyltransferase [Acidobacteria bacterium]|nr:DNA cytosine methyltransferase [Acidobacteriota bacterium]